MTTWLITRHPGARQWIAGQPLAIDRYCDHLDPSEVRAGDVVVGALPVHLAAAVCANGARYLNLCVDLPADVRGKELTTEELLRFNARIQEFHVTPVDGIPLPPCPHD